MTTYWVTRPLGDAFDPIVRLWTNKPEYDAKYRLISRESQLVAVKLGEFELITGLKLNAGDCKRITVTATET